MKKILFGCAIALSGLTMTPALAQDCCFTPQCDPCCYDMDFDGFYVGGNLGVLSHTAHRNDYDGHLTDNSGWTVIDSKLTAGLALGYDWNCCNKLFGLVVDWNWSNPNRRIRHPNSNPDAYIRNRFHWFTTIRARAGVTVCDALFYITAGAAVIRTNTHWFDSGDLFRHNRSRWGWVGGVGTEFLLGCNWSWGAEILMMHFTEHTRSFTGSGTAPSTFTFGHSDSAWIARLFINYRFGDLFGCCN